MKREIELSISADYVPNWDVWCAIRELVQNAADAHEQGFPMSIEYNPDSKEPTLIISNKGAVFNKDTLLLGRTTKMGTNQRGIFGEGYKLAWLTLLRLGYEVWLRTRNERWTPRIEHSDTFGADVLKVEIFPLEKVEDGVKMEIRGIQAADWELAKKRLILPYFNPIKPADVIAVGGNNILTAFEYSGQLFVKGIWVASLGTKYKFGYNFTDLSLDRDRKLANPWELKLRIAQSISRAVASKALSAEKVYQLLEEDCCEECRAIEDLADTQICESLSKDIVTQFYAAHGSSKNVIAVKSIQESSQAAHFGLKGVIVSRGIASLFAQVEGDTQTRFVSLETTEKVRFGYHDLSAEERSCIDWVISILLLLDVDKPVKVVEFNGKSVMGKWHNNEICLSRAILTNRAELVATAVHEAAHIPGYSDGEPLHQREMESLFGRLVAGWMKDV